MNDHSLFHVHAAEANTPLSQAVFQIAVADSERMEYFEKIHSGFGAACRKQKWHHTTFTPGMTEP